MYVFATDAYSGCGSPVVKPVLVKDKERNVLTEPEKVRSKQVQNNNRGVKIVTVGNADPFRDTKRLDLARSTAASGGMCKGDLPPKTPQRGSGKSEQSQ